MSSSNTNTTTNTPPYDAHSPPLSPHSPTEQLNTVDNEKLEYQHKFSILKRYAPHMNITIPDPDTSLEDLKARYVQYITKIKDIEEQEQQKQLQYVYQLAREVLDKQPTN